MLLADFIDQNISAILSAWDAFAASQEPAASAMDADGLRDHAELMLRAIASDLRTDQTAEEQARKSKGLARRASGSPRTAAQHHAAQRALGGFTIVQLVSEYRALRASVLRLYADACEPGPRTLAEIGRFNEAIDEAIAESVELFASEVERWRNVFLGVIGHDLRGPLAAIMMTAQVISKLGTGAPVDATARLIRNGERMRQLLDDLLDYSRTSLDLGISVRPAPVELASVCREEIDLRSAALPDRRIDFISNGPTAGSWDASRLKQLLGNLVDNAATYGEDGTPITVRLSGSSTSVTLSVENEGPPISKEALQSLFDPLRRGAEAPAANERAHLGLGLFVVKQVALAHGGTVEVTSDDNRTAFTVFLPKEWRRPA